MSCIATRDADCDLVAKARLSDSFRGRHPRTKYGEVNVVGESRGREEFPRTSAEDTRAWVCANTRGLCA